MVSFLRQYSSPVASWREGSRREEGRAPAAIGTRYITDHCALQVEHALVEGAKAAGAVLSAVVDSIRPKPITA